MIDMIPKKDLISGAYYNGFCRNSSIALWDDKKEIFIYIRYKFGFRLDEIEHFDDVKNTSMDGFVPVEKIKEIGNLEEAKLKQKIGY